MPPRPLPLLLVLSREALGWTQRELGENLGSSQRTATRWEGGSSHFDAFFAAKLAQHVYPADRELAAELAAATGQTLIGLGIEPPPPPPAPPATVALPPPPPPPPPPSFHLARPMTHRDLIEAIVCTVADAANVAPRAVRPTVLLTLQRAFEMGLDLNAAAAAGVLGPGGGPGGGTGTT